MEEVEEKLCAKFGFSSRHARLMTYFVQRQIEMIVPVSVVDRCRDSDDNRILAASLDSKCSHLVTGDRDLLILKESNGISIVTPRQFFDLLPRS